MVAVAIAAAVAAMAVAAAMVAAATAVADTVGAEDRTVANVVPVLAAGKIAATGLETAMLVALPVMQAAAVMTTGAAAVAAVHPVAEILVEMITPAMEVLRAEAL